jgi:hypothetical protein
VGVWWPPPGWGGGRGNRGVTKRGTSSRRAGFRARGARAVCRGGDRWSAVAPTPRIGGWRENSVAARNFLWSGSSVAVSEKFRGSRALGLEFCKTRPAGRIFWSRRWFLKNSGGSRALGLEFCKTRPAGRIFLGSAVVSEKFRGSEALGLEFCKTRPAGRIFLGWGPVSSSFGGYPATCLGAPRHIAYTQGFRGRRASFFPRPRFFSSLLPQWSKDLDDTSSVRGGG